jgi:hypothetical protein
MLRYFDCHVLETGSSCLVLSILSEWVCNAVTFDMIMDVIRNLSLWYIFDLTYKILAQLCTRTPKYIVRCMSGLVIEFIDRIHMVTISNYNAVANSCIRLLSFSLAVSWKRILTMSPAYVLTGWRICHNWLVAPTVDSQLTVLVITSRHGPYSKHRFSVALKLFPWEYVCNGCRVFAYSAVVA